MKKKSAAIAGTNTETTRMQKAHELEVERLAVKRELEEVMAKYAKLSGQKSLKKRKNKVGEAPNDYDVKAAKKAQKA